MISFDRLPKLCEPVFFKRLANWKKNKTTAVQTPLDLPRKTPCICSTEWSWDCTRWLSPPDAFTVTCPSHHSQVAHQLVPSMEKTSDSSCFIDVEFFKVWSSMIFLHWDLKSIQSSTALLPHVTTLPSSRIAAKACDEAAISRTPWSWSCTKPQRLIAGAVSTHTEGARRGHE